MGYRDKLPPKPLVQFYAAAPVHILSAVDSYEDINDHDAWRHDPACSRKAAMAMIETGQPVRAYGDFHHMTKSRSWARPRRVISKVEHKPGHEQRCRFLVTSLNRHQVPPGQLYEDIYCPRGDMENRIKDCQLDLFADRMSAHAYKANQVRLIFAAFAYVLIDGIRRVALKNTALANAVPSTIRLKLLKISARVVNSVRRIKLSLPDACPGKPCSSRLTPLWRPHSPNPSATTEKG